MIRPRRSYFAIALSAMASVASVASIAALAPLAPIAAIWLVAAQPAHAWTGPTQLQLGREAAGLAPADLARQIARHQQEFELGILDPFAQKDPARHMKNSDGSGSLDLAFEQEVTGAIAAIRGHRPFAEIARRLGAVSHFLADANNPLNTSASDPLEPGYFPDFLRYMESAEPRFALVFYGLDLDLDRRGDLKSLLGRTLARGRRLYPAVGREYRRVGLDAGRRAFDDRSTAFAVAALSYSHAVSDIARVFRYIWLAGGGSDERPAIASAGGNRLLLVPRRRQVR